MSEFESTQRVTHSAAIDAESRVRRDLAGPWLTYALRAVCELKIPDLLAPASASIDQLAARAGCRVEPLYRVLRALTGEGYFQEHPNREFSLTPQGALLRDGPANSLRALTLLLTGPLLTGHTHLAETLADGEPGFNKAHRGQRVFQYLSAHPEMQAAFQTAMAGLSARHIQAVLASYTFPDQGLYVDVGGGSGSFLAEILRIAPQARGIVLETAEATAHAQQTAAAADLKDRMRFEAGDFFRAVPSANYYLLKAILHDWPDEQARSILRCCRESALPGARLLIVETVLPESGGGSFANLLDVHMLVTTGGQERTPSSLSRLLGEAGWTYQRTLQTSSEVSIVEAVVTEEARLPTRP